MSNNEVLEKLKTDGVRITLDEKDRWMICEDDEYSVYERKRYAKRTIILYQGQSYHDAFNALLNE
jgi:hypothetical protein